MSAFEQVLDSYFSGWRDGYTQALDDVDRHGDRANRQLNTRLGPFRSAA